MDLLKLELTKFRRFEATSLDVLGRLVAIVGPNEAGKSSLLEALTRLNTNDELPPSDLTRGDLPAEADVVLTARFSLSQEDKASIEHIPEAQRATRFVVTKRRNGQRQGRLEPVVRRDRKLAGSALLLLRKVRVSKWSAEHQELIAERWDDADAALSSDAGTLSPEQIAHLQNVVDSLEAEPDRTNPARLRALLSDVITGEQRPHPLTAAVTILMPRMPEFILFGEADRALGSTYDLAATAAEPPPALANFAKLAKLNLLDARDVAIREDFGELETIERAANENLLNIFSTGWRQSVMSVQLRFDRAELRPVVQNRSGRFTELGERSDGLRIFVALVSYLAREERSVRPVLLIDEAETHLHYDAQADLIRVLSSQDAASKVIYTTHSAGSLPFDLGTGIRVVRMKEGDRSEVDNSFWSSGAGFTPLVMAMGAAALAFTPTRRAVIGEGITESILLPTMLREATGPTEVDYQIVPGLSNANTEVINSLDLEAARVAFLLDGDKAGRDRRKSLERIGVPADRIVLLGLPDKKGLVLEDLLRADVYRAAVNAELETWQSGLLLPASAVTSRGRVVALAAWCGAKGIPVPDKKRVASQVLQLRAGETITTTQSRIILRALHEQLRGILDRPRLGLA